MKVNYFTILYWFCHTSTWICHRYIRVPHPETPLPPPSPYHPSGSSQCTSPKHPVSCIKPGLAIRSFQDFLFIFGFYCFLVDLFLFTLLRILKCLDTFFPSKLGNFIWKKKPNFPFSSPFDATAACMMASLVMSYISLRLCWVFLHFYSVLQIA